MNEYLDTPTTPGQLRALADMLERQGEIATAPEWPSEPVQDPSDLERDFTEGSGYLSVRDATKHLNRVTGENFGFKMFFTIMRRWGWITPKGPYATTLALENGWLFWDQRAGASLVTRAGYKEIVARRVSELQEKRERRL
jgi:hypothetical protein